MAWITCSSPVSLEPTDGRGTTWGSQEGGRGGEIVELLVVQDTFPDGMSELLRDF